MKIIAVLDVPGGEFCADSEEVCQYYPRRSMVNDKCGLFKIHLKDKWNHNFTKQPKCQQCKDSEIKE